ncbi:hypothetical protein [Pectobacterium carotovorum]|uniref:Porin n=1 Tax=Pectobacterium carotovorum TaxID=554 RepID=A0A419AWP2_PECCA|nr:hypothetical protein [Pectobacterium carotovorum]RJL51730.1 hypothetical protein D5071_09960 [Pectobacterium carotovorum]
MQELAVKRLWLVYGLWSLAAIPLQSNAENADFNYQLQSDLRSYSYQGEKYRNSQDFNLYSDSYAQLMANFSSRYQYQRLSVPVKIRASEKYSFDKNNDQSDTFVDEAFLDYSVTDTFILNLGRRQLVNGVAIGNNPTDFLNANKSQDRHLADQQRRSEIKGDDIVGVINYFSSSSVQFYYLPSENASWLQYAYNFPFLNADAGISYYHNDINAVGVNISTTFTDNITGYIENSFSDKRNRAVVDTQGNFHRDSGLFTDLVVGTQYTFDNGININSEYWYNQHGYTKDEYENISGAVATGKIKYVDASRYLSQRNRYKNKLFMRLSDIPVNDDIKLEQTFIYDLERKSHFLRSTIIGQLSTNSTLRASLEFYQGKAQSEYGGNPINYGVFLSWQYFWESH